MSSTTASGRNSSRGRHGLGSGVGHRHLPALVAQCHRDQLGDVDLVVDDQHAQGGAVGPGQLHGPQPAATTLCVCCGTLWQASGHDSSRGHREGHRWRGQRWSHEREPAQRPRQPPSTAVVRGVPGAPAPAGGTGATGGRAEPGLTTAQDTAAPAPAAQAPAANSGPRLRDRLFGLRAMIGVGLAGLVLGGLGGVGVGAVAGHDDRDGRGGHHRGFEGRSGDDAGGGSPRGPGSGVPSGSWSALRGRRSIKVCRRTGASHGVQSTGSAG